MAGGLVTPGAHDGMAAFDAGGSLIRIVRNHEIRSGSAFAESPVYDNKGGGGTTTVEFDGATGSFLGAQASLAGTAVNCAGDRRRGVPGSHARRPFLGPGGEESFDKPPRLRVRSTLGRCLHRPTVPRDGPLCP